MAEQFDVQAALRAAMQTEKDAMDFYRYGAEKMAEEAPRRTFAILAKDELQHARSFYDADRGDILPPFADFIAAPPNTESSWWQALQRMMLTNFNERRALELAIDQEEALEQELRAVAAQIPDPEVRRVYEANAHSTHNHALLIAEELKALYGQSR